MKRGEVWWANLPKPVGRRPVVLLSRNAAYPVRASVTVAPSRGRSTTYRWKSVWVQKMVCPDTVSQTSTTSSLLLKGGWSETWQHYRPKR